MKVLIIDNHDSFTYNLVELLRRLDVRDIGIVKNEDALAATGPEYDRIIISPGPGLPSETSGLIPFIRDLAPKRSILGVCLGHQAIAECYGAKLFRQETVMHGVSCRVRITDREHYLFRDVPDCFEAGLYHSWAVAETSFPESLEILALSAEGVIMALKHKEFDVCGIQFHPESIMTGQGPRIIRNFLYRDEGK